MASLTWHGHATCSIRLDDGTSLLIDPFFDDNPRADIPAAEAEADWPGVKGRWKALKAVKPFWR